jgi:transcriptional regulator with XRE-family HTH domain
MGQKMAGLEDVPRENLQKIAEMCATARSRLRKQQQEVAAEARVSPGMVSLIERSGPYPGMRAYDFLRLIEYYRLNIFEISTLLGVRLFDPTQQETPFASQARIIDSLSEEKRAWIIGVVDALLRGMQ